MWYVSWLGVTGMIVRRKATATLTAVEVFHGDTIEFERADGTVVPIEVLSTSAALAPVAEGYSGKKFWQMYQDQGQRVM